MARRRALSARWVSARFVPTALLVIGTGGCALDAPTLGSGTGTGKTGEQVYAQVCAACHATGVEKAPQYGDRAAWKPLIEEGQDVLTAHAWVGVRGMPPQGGDPTLALEEFARATAHMVRAAGGDWPNPDAAMLARIRDEERDRREKMKDQRSESEEHDEDDEDDEHDEDDEDDDRKDDQDD